MIICNYDKQKRMCMFLYRNHLSYFHVNWLQIYGYEIWDFTLPGNITSAQMFELTLYISSSLTNLPPIAYNVYNSYKNKSGSMRSFTEAIRPLVSVVILFILTTLWIVKAPNVLETDPTALFFVTGIIFSNICVRTRLLTSIWKKHQYFQFYFSVV